jgi:hypothetical protein
MRSQTERADKCANTRQPYSRILPCQENSLTMQNSAITGSANDTFRLNEEDWQIALEPYAGHPLDALSLVSVEHTEFPQRWRELFR